MNFVTKKRACYRLTYWKRLTERIIANIEAIEVLETCYAGWQCLKNV